MWLNDWLKSLTLDEANMLLLFLAALFAAFVAYLFFNDE